MSRKLLGAWALAWATAFVPRRLPRAPRGALRAVATLGSCEELDALVAEHAGSKAIIIDYSNTFCGPCKLIEPKFQALSEMYDALFFKCLFDDSEAASALGKREKVRIVPAFHIWKDGRRLEVVEGMKPELLVAAVSRACGSGFWSAPLARARRKVAKFGVVGALGKLLRNGWRQVRKRLPF